jgi:hypothetical protein
MNRNLRQVIRLLQESSAWAVSWKRFFEQSLLKFERGVPRGRMSAASACASLVELPLRESRIPRRWLDNVEVGGNWLDLADRFISVF